MSRDQELVPRLRELAERIIYRHDQAVGEAKRQVHADDANLIMETTQLLDACRVIPADQDEVRYLNGEVKRLREALEAIRDGRWGIELGKYPRRFGRGALWISVPAQAEIRCLARAALARGEGKDDD